MKKVVFAVMCGVLVGCKSPFERTRDASNGGATGIVGTSATFVIFSNEIRSGGGAFEYPGGENQSLTFADTSNPLSYRSIRYSWTGSPAAAGSTDHTLAGFVLMHTAVQTDYAGTAGHDLRGAAYTKVTFYARGSLSTNTDAKIEVSDDGNTATAAPCLTLSTSGTSDLCSGALAMPPQALTSAWQKYTITVPNASLAIIKDFFKSTFVFTDPFVGNLQPGQGGTVYYDNIQYEQ